MPLLHLVRHASHDEVGHVLSGRSAIGLNGCGIRQANALVSALDEVTFASVHSSPRQRATQTAAPIAAARNMTVCVAAELDEIDFGSFTGLAFSALEHRADWQEWNALRQTARCPGGETMEEATSRALDFLYSLGAVGAPALCITHCDIIRGVVVRLLDIPVNRMFALECEPASITTISIEPGQIRLVELNRRVLR